MIGKITAGLGKYEKLTFLLIFFLGVCLRFYNLNWGENNFFHPDEYHIVISVNQLSFPNQLNPHLFSYGSFTVYIIYFTKLLLSNIFKTANIPDPFLIGRFYAALFSSLTIITTYLISRCLIKNKYFNLVVMYLTAIAPGLIQQAHFLTPESIMTFWITLFIFNLLRYLNNSRNSHLYFSAICLGLAASVKVTSFIIIPILLLAIFYPFGKGAFNRIKIKSLITSIVIVFISFFIFFPYSFLDFSDFKNSITYEGSLAVGKQIVFYTRQFTGKIPFYFQVTKILPYTMGPTVLIFGTIGLLIAFYNLLSKPKNNPYLLIIIFAFLFLFIPNCLLFTKWTRFIYPSFPFFIIFSVYLFDYLYAKFKGKLQVNYFIVFLITATLIITTGWSIMFFSIYNNPDVRITATRWIESNIPVHSTILTETGNTIEVPISGNYLKIPFDFYNLDEDIYFKRQLIDRLTESNYFIIQSRRIFANQANQNSNNSAASNFYSGLFNGRLGFTEIAEFNSFPRLEIGGWKLEINDEQAEETWSVFDHPVIRIYKKVKSFSKNDYAKILKI